MNIQVPPGDTRGKSFYRREVEHAVQGILRFASKNGWDDDLQLYWHRGIEIFASQDALWARLVELRGLPSDTPIPSRDLAAVIEQGRLLAVDPDVYNRSQTDLTTTAYRHLLSRTIAHRLHETVAGGAERKLGRAGSQTGLPCWQAKSTRGSRSRHRRTYGVSYGRRDPNPMQSMSLL